MELHGKVVIPLIFKPDKVCLLYTSWKNRGAQIKTGLYWTRKTKAKAVLIESFFCDNASDYAKAKKLGYDAHGKLIAEGILGKNISGSAGDKPGSKPETGGDYVFKPATVKKGDKNKMCIRDRSR